VVHHVRERALPHVVEPVRPVGVRRRPVAAAGDDRRGDGLALRVEDAAADRVAGEDLRAPLDVAVEAQAAEEHAVDADVDGDLVDAGREALDAVASQLVGDGGGAGVEDHPLGLVVLGGDRLPEMRRTAPATNCLEIADGAVDGGAAWGGRGARRR
jgi:hypothetical protein